MEQLVTSDGVHLGVADPQLRPPGEPHTWVSVYVSKVDRSRRLVPLDHAAREADGVHVPYTFARIVSAPPVSLDAGGLAALHAHYEAAPVAAPSVVHSVVAAEVVRQEERLQLRGVEWRPYKRLRARVVVREEEVVQRVRVRRQELVLEEEPISMLERLETSGGGNPQPQQIEFTLCREEVVVGTRVLPYERVRVRTEMVAHWSDVEETVRKEVVDLAPGDGVDHVSGNG